MVPYAHGYLAIATGWKAPRAVAADPARAVAPGAAGPHRPAALGAVAADLGRRPQPRRSTAGSSTTPRSRTAPTGAASGSRPPSGPIDQFRPVGRHPLVCPRRGGVIDPSAFVGRHHRRYLRLQDPGQPGHDPAGPTHARRPAQVPPSTTTSTTSQPRDVSRDRAAPARQRDRDPSGTICVGFRSVCTT